MKKVSSKAWRWVCLAGVVVGCNDLSGRLDNDDENVQQARLAYTQHQPNSWLSGCVGTPNGICDTGETNFNCAPDCSCGDGHCAGPEQVDTCPIDCKFGSDPSIDDDFCGNHRCEPWEHDGLGLDCAQDCFIAPSPAGATCGDTTCEPGETSATCPVDCGNKASCGDRICDPTVGETPATCDTDCTNFNVPANRFSGTYCATYELLSQFSNGSGTNVDHSVTPLAAGCDVNAVNTAAPWKLVYNAQTCNNSQLLKPDGSTCTITGANCPYDANWATLGTEYVMSPDPNKCGTYRTTPNGNFHPMEWAKTGTVNCGQIPGGCTVYQCDGSSVKFTSTIKSVWRPQLARWSIYAEKCLP